MALVDEETRQMILKKTWCHGQAVLPLFSIITLAWWWHMEAPRPLQLVFSSLVLPIWSWYSCHTVLSTDNTGESSYPKICSFGVFAMLAHAFIFQVAIQNLGDTVYMLMTIASGLFLVETGAFLLVVTVFRNSIGSNTATSTTRPLYTEEHYY